MALLPNIICGILKKKKLSHQGRKLGDTDEFKTSLYDPPLCDGERERSVVWEDASENGGRWKSKCVEANIDWKQ